MTRRLTLGAIFRELEVTDWADIKSLKGTMGEARLLEDHFGAEKPIRTITYSDLLDFVRAEKEKGKAGGTINRKLAILSKAFKVARRHDPSLVKPEFPYQKGSKPRERVLSDAELNRLLAWEGWRPRFRALATFLADTGCRLGEALAVEKMEVRGDECTFKDTKNGTSRTIVLTPRVKAAMPLIKQLKKADRWTFGIEYKKACAALELKGDGPLKVCIHTLRHTAVTTLAENTDNVLLIQKWAGHTSLVTTQRYMKATRKGMEKLAEVMARRQ